MPTDPMSPEEMRVRIAEACGYRIELGPNHPPEMLVIGPDGLRINTSRLNGRSIEQATNDSLCYLPDYLGCLDDCHEGEKAIGLHDKTNTALRVAWVNNLRVVFAEQPDCPQNKVGTPMISDIDLLLMRSTLRAKALYLTTLNLTTPRQ